MNNNKFAFHKGQTLMEILIYIAIFGTVAASLVGIVWNVTKIHSYQLASNEVDNNLRYAMNLLNDKVRGASSVESASDSTLVLKMPDNTTTIFNVATSGILYIQEGNTDPVAVISDRVVVSNLTFEKIDMAGAKGGARIKLTLSYVPKEGGETSIQRTLLSAVTRSATAISFSEDIVPGQDNSFSVGSASYGWKNGYFSGDLTVDGIISGTAFCISSDCKTAWPSGGGGTITGSGTTNKVSKWTSSSALGDSLILDNGTNIGVGETNPASGAVFSVVGNATFAGNSGAWNGGNPYLQFSHDSTTSYIDQNSSGRNIHIRAKNSGGSLGDQLFLQNGGNVGIGTTDPNYSLHIHSTAAGTDRRIQLSDATSGSGTADGLQLIKSTDQSAWLWNYENAAMHFGTNGAEGLTLLSGGNVGVGTNDPGAKLDVANAADEILRLSRATASYPTKFKVGTDSAFVINSGNSDVLAIKSGKVGIGLTSPTSTLSVAGTVESTTGGFKFPDGTTQTTAAGSSVWTTSGNDIYNSNSGNVGIGNTGPSYKLDVSGDVNISGKLREDGVEILSGMITMFDGACPTGWTRFTALDSTFPRGAATYGGTGGASTHTHAVGNYVVAAEAAHTHSIDPPSTESSQTASASDVASSGSTARLPWDVHTHTVNIAAFSSAAGSSHTHGLSGSSASESSLPPYLNMVFCKKNAGADVAEWTLAKEKYEPATLVSLDSSNTKTVKASDQAYDSALAGIVTTEPGWILGRETSQKVLLALSGQVPLKVASLNGVIKIGDPITSSAILGTGMKATEAGPIVAKAMEDFNPDNLAQQIRCPKGTPAGVACGKIMVLVNVSWYGGDGSQNIFARITERVKDALASLGIWIENQIVKVKELVAEKISAHKIRVEELEMIDKKTGEIYCAWIANGEWLKDKGECL